MDKAVCGFCRCGYCRCGVYVDFFNDIKLYFEKLSAKGGGLDPSLFDCCRFDYTRFDVILPFFEQIKKKVEAAS